MLLSILIFREKKKVHNVSSQPEIVKILFSWYLFWVRVNENYVFSAYEMTSTWNYGSEEKVIASIHIIFLTKFVTTKTLNINTYLGDT